MRALCAALAASGQEVELYATHPAAARAGERRTVGRLQTTEFRRDWPSRLCVSAGLRAAVHATTAEIVHHHALWLRTLHYAHQAARQRNVPLVVSPRGMMSAWAWQFHPTRKRLARAVVHPGAFEAVAGWHATSADEAADIRALGFNQPICVAPNGVEPATPAEVAAAAEHWREACPAVQDQPVALFYSRLHQKKRVLELIDVWLEHGPTDWLLLIVGLPQDYTPATLEAHVQRRSGRGRVAVFSGAGRPAPYAVASLFLLPSHNENFGLVIAEAMAHGVPVLVTDTTPWAAVQPEQLGWCVPWAQYAPALRAATAEGPERLRAKGARAREWVLREFSWLRSARLLDDFYAALARRPA